MRLPNSRPPTPDLLAPIRSLLMTRLSTALSLIVLTTILAAVPVRVVSGQSTAEWRERRSQLAAAHPDALIILPGRWEEKAMEQPGWIQEPSFFYFTGLANIPGAILLIDGRSNTHILFAAPSPSSFGVPIEDLDLLSRDDLIAESGIDAVLPMDRFTTYVTRQLELGNPILKLNAPRMPESGSLPEGMLAVSGFHALWQQSLEASFPDARFGSVAETIQQMRWVKSDTEIRLLRPNGLASAAALRAGMKAVAAGRTQRQAEATVIASCLESGMEGPSFWPWVMGGPNAHLQNVIASFRDYHHLNRTFLEGELVRVDIGCMSGGYGGDVGRTIPVSGTFSQEQGTIWDLLVTGYQAGVRAMRPGVSVDDIAEAARSAIQEAGEADPAVVDLATLLSSPDGVSWHIHGVGIESGESPADGILRAGSVLAFEPMVSVGDHAYYLEDMWLITDAGVENLTPDLPTSRNDIEHFLSR